MSEYRGNLTQEHIENYHQDQLQSTEIPDHLMKCNDFIVVDYIRLSLS